MQQTAKLILDIFRHMIMSVFELVDIMVSYCYAQQQQAQLKAKLTLLLSAPKRERQQQCVSGLATKD